MGWVFSYIPNLVYWKGLRMLQTFPPAIGRSQRQIHFVMVAVDAVFDSNRGKRQQRSERRKPRKRKRGKGASTGCVPGLRGGTCSGTWKKWYWSWCLIEHLFVYEGRLVMTSRNWLHCQWWHCMTSCMTRHTITTSVAMTIRRLPWLVAQQVVWPVCDLLQFGITEHEFWTWPSTLLRLIFL